MATLCSASIAISSLIMLFLAVLPSIVLSQGPLITPVPTMTDCTARLLPLTPCAPFVQGLTNSPVQPCCDNLNQLNKQQPVCLCFLLNSTNLSSFPINSTLALELPVRCNVPVDISACSGPREVPPSSPASQVILGSHGNSSVASNSSVAASPMVQVAPRPTTIMGIGGLGESIGAKLAAEGPVKLLVTQAAVLAIATCWV